MKKIKEFLRMCWFGIWDGIDRISNPKTTMKGLALMAMPVLIALGFVDKSIESLFAEKLLNLGSAVAGLILALQGIKQVFSLDKKPGK